MPLPVGSVLHRIHTQGGKRALSPLLLAGLHLVMPSSGGRGGEEQESGRWEAASNLSRRLRGPLERILRTTMGPI